MDVIGEFLRNWMKKYFENRDLYLKTIKDIKETADGFTVVYKDKEVVFFIMSTLDAAAFSKLATDKKAHYGIATYNTKENLKILTDRWTSFTDHPSLSIYFVNPFAEGDNKWIIRPQTHDRITEKESLALGLQTLFEGVAETTLSHVEHMAKK